MSNLRTLSAFKSTLEGGGARPNLFEVSIPKFPGAATASTPSLEWTDGQKNCKLSYVKQHSYQHQTLLLSMFLSEVVL